MSIAAGTKLGPYEIVSAIGAGGMGEVYRAHDTKLNRDVALKILPEAFTSDADRLARFTREAQTLASLNHPHIAQIYGLEESAGVRALVMELVEGEDLQQRIAHGPIPIDEARSLARQIAEALEAAHEKGIVHRDLKPANIKVTPDGSVKLLDFGLAKAMLGEPDVSSGSGGVSKSPTRSHLMTQEGIILGTMPYMSPEQAKGKAVDKRTDVWAFGVVFFEMLTGKQLFHGETVSDVIAAVLTRDPDWKALPASVPKSIRSLLARCLERDVTQRLRDIGEARIALGKSDAPEFSETAPAVAASRGPMIAAALILALIVGAAAFFAGRRTATSKATPVQSDLKPGSFSLVTDQPGVETQPSLSPDGRSVAYVKETKGQLDIYVVRVGGRNSVNLTPDSEADDMEPAFSPDGESIAFRSERDHGGIFIMGSTGESVRRVTDFGHNPAWSPDGKRLVVGSAFFTFPQDRPAPGSLWIVDIATGEKKPLTQDFQDAAQPSWSPHGNRIAYWGLRPGSGQRDLWTIAADGSELKTGGVAITDDTFVDWSPVWSPNGDALYFSSNRGGTLNLWKLGIDEHSGRVLGEPEPLTVPSGWAGNPSLSRDGKRLAFSALEWRSRLEQLAFDPVTGKVAGSPVSILESSYPIRDHAVSPDGKWVAFDAYAGSQEDLFMIGSDGSGLRRLTDDAARDRGPIWSPDAQHIAFYSDRSGAYNIWTIRPDGSGLEQLSRSGFSNFPTYSPDGQRISASTAGQRSKSGPSGWAIISSSNPQDAYTQMPEADSETRFWPFSWSTDNLHIAGELMKADGSMQDLAVFTFADSKFRRLHVPLAGIWSVTAWLSDSQRLLYRDRRGIFLLNTAGGVPQQLVSVGGYYIGKSLGITADDRTITYSETATEGDIWMVDLGPTQK